MILTEYIICLTLIGVGRGSLKVTTNSVGYRMRVRGAIIEEVQQEGKRVGGDSSSLK